MAAAAGSAQGEREEPASPTGRLSAHRRLRSVIIAIVLAFGTATTLLVLNQAGFSLEPLHLPLLALLSGTLVTSLLLWLALVALALRGIGLQVAAQQSSRQSLGRAHQTKTTVLLVCVVALLAISLSVHPALGSPNWVENQLEFTIRGCPHNRCIVTPGGGSFDVPFPGNDAYEASTLLVELSVVDGSPVQAYLGTGEAYTHIDPLNRTEVINNALARSAPGVSAYRYDGATLARTPHVLRLYDDGNQTATVEVHITLRLDPSLSTTTTGLLGLHLLLGAAWWWSARAMAQGPKVRALDADRPQQQTMSRKKLRCPSCQKTFAVAAEPRPLDVECPHCNYQATLP